MWLSVWTSGNLHWQNYNGWSWLYLTRRLLHPHVRQQPCWQHQQLNLPGGAEGFHCAEQHRPQGNSNNINNNNIIIIIAFKSAVSDFLQSPRCATNRLQYVRSSGQAQSCENHVQHIERLSRATHQAPITCSMSLPLDTKGQLSC